MESTMQRQNSALATIYGQRNTEKVDFTALVQAVERPKLTELELEAATALQGMLGAPVLGISQQEKQEAVALTAKIMQIPAQAYGFIDAGNKLKRQHPAKPNNLFMQGLASLAQASNIMSEKENNRTPSASAGVMATKKALAPKFEQTKAALAPVGSAAKMLAQQPPLKRELENVTLKSAKLERTKVECSVQKEQGKSRYSAFRKASTCPFCAQIGVNCGRVAAKCPNRPCNKCGRRHRLNRCKRTHCKHCLKEDHLSSKCPVKLREWARASVARRREQRLKNAAAQQ